jgi:hypothetical protein
MCMERFSLEKWGEKDFPCPGCRSFNVGRRRYLLFVSDHPSATGAYERVLCPDCKKVFCLDCGELLDLKGLKNDGYKRKSYSLTREIKRQSKHLKGGRK